MARQRHDFGASILPHYCSYCASLCLNRGCRDCNAWICRKCWDQHDCSGHSTSEELPTTNPPRHPSLVSPLLEEDVAVNTESIASWRIHESALLWHQQQGHDFGASMNLHHCASCTSICLSSCCPHCYGLYCRECWKEHVCSYAALAPVVLVGSEVLAQLTRSESADTIATFYSDCDSFDLYSKADEFEATDELSLCWQENCAASCFMKVSIRILALSGESLLGPVEVSSGTRIRRLVQQLDQPEGQEALLFQNGIPLYDTQRELASFLQDDATEDEMASLDFNLLWRKQIRQGDCVVVHEDIPVSIVCNKSNVPCGERGRVCKILGDVSEDSKARSMYKSSWKHRGDALICFVSKGNIWVSCHHLCRMHVDPEASRES